MCSFSIIFTSLHSLEFYHFHCFPVPFLLLYLSFNLDSVHHHPDFRIVAFPSRFHPDFKKIVTLVKKQTLPFVTTA